MVRYAFLGVLVLVGAVNAQEAVAPAGPTVPPAGPSSSIRKVITLIEDMRAQVEADGKADDEAYEEYHCWCVTTQAEKEKAIADAKADIERLNTVVEESEAKISQLQTEVEGHKQDIQEFTDALDQARSIRAEEQAAFEKQSAYLQETIGDLEKAVAILEKVQLVQKEGKKPDEAMLLQVDTIVKKTSQYAQFRGVMQQDLFDVLSSFGSKSFLNKKGASFAEQPHGAAAGAKSYNSQSGQIFGILSEMKDEMGRDLKQASEAEANAQTAFANLEKAKNAEIAAAEEQVKTKEKLIAELQNLVVQSKYDLEKITKQLGVDTDFLENMIKECTMEDEEYAKRSKLRGEEVVAITECLQILTEEGARDLYAKTQMTLLQVNTATSARRTLNKAMKRIVAVARKHKDWILASLAVRSELDSFTKVKAMIDKMVTDLKTEQAEEVAKKEECDTNIDKAEDDIKAFTYQKEDLESLKTKLDNLGEELNAKIAQLTKEVKDTEIALKQAGENRRAENALYVRAVQDQRALIQILNKALARLQEFYTPDAVTAGASPAPATALVQQKPPRPSGKAYSQAGNSGGVMQLLQMIITDASGEEKEMIVDEQNAQSNYEQLAKDATQSIEANRGTIEAKKKALATRDADLAETEEKLLSKNKEIEDTNNLLTGYHADCDWILKYFDVRQTGRAEEIDALGEAKAILSGANYGS